MPVDPNHKENMEIEEKIRRAEETVRGLAEGRNLPTAVRQALRDAVDDLVEAQRLVIERDIREVAGDSGPLDEFEVGAKLDQLDEVRDILEAKPHEGTTYAARRVMGELARLREGQSFFEQPSNKGSRTPRAAEPVIPR
jgi:hypothetical protein